MEAGNEPAPNTFAAYPEHIFKNDDEQTISMKKQRK